MNIVEITGLNGPNGSESGKTELKFPSKADFTLEILPSVFKAKVFAGFDIVWIDPGVAYSRTRSNGKPEKRPVMIPVRICSSGYNPNIADRIKYALEGGGSVFSLSDGKSYRVSLKKEKTSESDHESEASSADGSSETRPSNCCYKASPVRESAEPKAAYAFAPEDEASAGTKTTKLSDRL